MTERKYPKVGEVWSEASGRWWLVLGVSSGYCNAVLLAENAHNPMRINVNGKAMYTNPGMLTYVLERNYGEMLCSVEAEEMARVRRGAAAALGVQDDHEALMREIAGLNAQIVSLREELALWRGERDNG